MHPVRNQTRRGTVWFAAPLVVPVAQTHFNPASKEMREVVEFLTDPETADQYVTQPVGNATGVDLLSKFGGQLCYLSFGENSTPHERCLDYLTHIKEAAHGSVFEHPSVTFFLGGVSRSLTHELVRHRAGFGFSQVSQRYTDQPRFVKRPEFNSVPLQDWFEEYIDNAVIEYEQMARNLFSQQIRALEGQNGGPLAAESKTELRKEVRGAARYCLPNCTEAPILVTANIRAWRHFLNMRGSMAAELEIRRVAVLIHDHLSYICPNSVADFDVTTLMDGTSGVDTPYPKV